MWEFFAMGAPTYVLERRQWLPGGISGVFDFFCDPHNLARLTPDFLDFKILAVTGEPVSAGTLIDYRLKVHGLPVFWRTRIQEWHVNESFVDTQLRGPYVLWHHTHKFTEKDGGVEMSDIVRYRLPFGPIGMIIHKFIVRRDVESIFDYRSQIIAQIFSEENAQQPVS